MAGIYIHIPFCKSRCIYCDFYSTTRLQDREEYVRCIEQETALRAPAFAQQMANKGDILKTVYFGGGTPSMLCERHVDDILYSIRSSFCHTQIQEITLEANPGDLSEDKLRGLREAGINRLSLGVQSFQDRFDVRLAGADDGSMDGGYRTSYSARCGACIGLLPDLRRGYATLPDVAKR